MKHPILTKLSLYGWRSSLVLVATSAALVMVFGSPGNIKQALRSSDTYPTVASSLAQAAISKTNDISSVPLAQEDIEQAANQTFTPESMRSTTEKAIDSTYAWLEGETETPDVGIDTSAYADSFASNLAAKVAQRADAKDGNDTRPACSTTQLQQIVGSVQVVNGDSSQLDTSKLACSPTAGVSNLISGTLKSEAQKASTSGLENAINSKALPFNTTTDAASGGKDLVLDGQAVSQHASYLPTVYLWSVLVPWVFTGLAILFAASVLLLNRGADLRDAIRRLARSTLVVGIILAVLAVLSRLITAFVSKPDGSLSRFVSDGYGHAFVSFTSALERSLDTVLFIFGIVYIAIASFVLFYLRWQAQHLDIPAKTEATQPNDVKQ